MVYVGKKIGLKACGNKINKESDPWWKRRIKKMANEVRKHINILEYHQTGEIRKKKIPGTWKEVYHIEKRGRRGETEAPCKNSKAEENEPVEDQKNLYRKSEKSFLTDEWYKRYY